MIHNEAKEADRLAKLEELAQLKRLDKVYDSLTAFVEVYLSPHIPTSTPAFHYDIYTLLERIVPRTLIIAPRGFAKSTLASKFTPLYMALTGRAKDIIIVSATVSLAKEHLRWIRQELEYNELILKDFGSQTSEKWTEDHIILKNGCQIRAKGRGFQIRGFRPDVVICDDLEDEEVIYSKEQRDKMEAWFFRTLLPALKPQQKLIYIGTILHQYSLINKLKEKAEFEKLEFKALLDGQSIWEELFPTQYLLRLRTEMGVYAFEAEYQNNPLSLENQPIKPHMLDVDEPKGKSILRVMTVDPAISEKEVADYSVIAVFDKTDDLKFKLVAKVRKRLPPDALTDEIIRMYKEYEPNRVLIEEFAFQKVIRFILIKKTREIGLFMPIATATVGSEVGVKTYKRPRDKMSRLMQVMPLFEQKAVYINDEEMKQEMLAFPFGDHDDMVDAAVYALYWLMKFQAGGAMVKKEASGSPIKTIPSIHLVIDKNGNATAVHEPIKININKSFVNTEKKL